VKWWLPILLFISSPVWAGPEIHTLQRGSYRQILAAHQGKPLIVAMWSVSCTHCSADLEIFRKLARQYPAFNLVLISTDTPDVQAEIAGILGKYSLLGAGRGKVESWVFADSFSERLRYEIDPQWYGELPRTYFIDANGKTRGVSGVLNEQATEQWVRASQ
jgi:hypothetical protein